MPAKVRWGRRNEVSPRPMKTSNRVRLVDRVIAYLHDLTVIATFTWFGLEPSRTLAVGRLFRSPWVVACFCLEVG